MKLRIAAALLVLAGFVGLTPLHGQAVLDRERAHAIRFSNGDVQLDGWLQVPSGKGPLPVVILVGGNSASWRVYDWYFRIIADSLNAAGIGAFYYDHRGDRGSSGNWAFSAFEDLADDVIAAANALARDHRVTRQGIGVLGHSMGGWIAPLAAARSEAIRFVITVAGPGVPPLTQTSHDHMMRDIRRGMPVQTAVEMDALRRELWAYYTNPTDRRRQHAQRLFDWAKTRGWISQARSWRELQGVRDALPPVAVLSSPAMDTVLAELRRDAVHDPIPALQQVAVPLLALFGEADEVVPLEMSIAGFRTAFAVSGNKGLTLRTFSNANHLLLTSGRQTAEAFAPDYIPILRRFVLSVTSNIRNY